jgi:hypothetical protein
MIAVKVCVAVLDHVCYLYGVGSTILAIRDKSDAICCVSAPCPLEFWIARLDREYFRHQLVLSLVTAQADFGKLEILRGASSFDSFPSAASWRLFCFCIVLILRMYVVLCYVLTTT